MLSQDIFEISVIRNMLTHYLLAESPEINQMLEIALPRVLLDCPEKKALCACECKGLGEKVDAYQTFLFLLQVMKRLRLGKK